MGTTGTKYTSSVCVFFEMGPTGTKYVLYWGVGERFMAQVPSMSCIGVWGSDLWVPRVPGILLLCDCFCVTGTTGSKYVVYSCVG